MKKSNIMIAVFAVIAAVSAAPAGNVDFDGQSSKETLSTLASLAIEPNLGYGIPLPQEPGMEPMPGIPGQSWPHQNLPPIPFQDFGCGLVCLYGAHPYKWCACYDPGNPLDGFQPNWGDIIAFVPGRKVEFKRINPAESQDLQKKLVSILLGYCNTYPEFAAAVLPALQGKPVVTADKGFAYVMYGDRGLRLPGTAKYLENSGEQKAGLNSALAADTVINAVSAWAGSFLND